MIFDEQATLEDLKKDEKVIRHNQHKDRDLAKKGIRASGIRHIL